MPTMDTKIEAEVLSVRFDAGYWLLVDHGAKSVLRVEDLGGEPRAGRVPCHPSGSSGERATVGSLLASPYR